MARHMMVSRTAVADHNLSVRHHVDILAENSRRDAVLEHDHRTHDHSFVEDVLTESKAPVAHNLDHAAVRNCNLLGIVAAPLQHLEMGQEHVEELKQNVGQTLV
ncbi:hypothetical protein TorRG33x02_254550 [Trema orientale]|uniref:Uncharacterized protein n=1 Tax=Trema orientale TaxID=63057 RepID=A0A2P5DDL8_TREOI|nr:hypothetical protein TorRG33x02_254550 [Trema orientale]